MFCILCQKETFWVIEHTFHDQINKSSNCDKDYICTTILSGPCYGYKCMSQYRQRLASLYSKKKIHKSKTFVKLLITAFIWSNFIRL